MPQEARPGALSRARDSDPPPGCKARSAGSAAPHAGVPTGSCTRWNEHWLLGLKLQKMIAASSRMRQQRGLEGVAELPSADTWRPAPCKRVPLLGPLPPARLSHHSEWTPGRMWQARGKGAYPGKHLWKDGARQRRPAPSVPPPVPCRASGKAQCVVKSLVSTGGILDKSTNREGGSAAVGRGFTLGRARQVRGQEG